MATREKKLSVSRKQNMSLPISSKEETSNDVITNVAVNGDVSEQVEHNCDNKTSMVKKFAYKRVPKTIRKKTAGIKLKAIKRNVKVKEKIKAILINPNKKKLKNCVNNINKKRNKLVKTIINEENLLPGFEQNMSVDVIDNGAEKKKGVKALRIDSNGKKCNEADGENLVTEQIKIKRNKRKPKSDPNSIDETIEDVIKDLTYLIKNTEVKKENDTAVISEINKMPVVKPKKLVGRKKKENIVDTLNKLTPAERNIIDRLDLNVSKITEDVPVAKRRHSIEKFPVGLTETTAFNRLGVLNNLPLCISPRTKHFRLKQTIDGFVRRSNPYKTRSDSPARILRNGKQRKLKDSALLDGLDSTYKKRRRRNCSEFSGSEMSLSKLSGYESDSSFSDMSSLHGAENSEIIKSEVKDAEEKKQVADDLKDSNSNVYLKENGTSLKTEDLLVSDAGASPSLKVPEKSIILDIMKQTFNDIFDEKDMKYLKSEAEKENSESFYRKTLLYKENADTNQENEDKSDANVTIKEEAENAAEDVPMDVQEGENAVVCNGASRAEPMIEETPEDLVIKESILQALGLQSMKAAQEAKLNNGPPRLDYTGTLKAVIKISRGDKKKGRPSTKMVLLKTKKRNQESASQENKETATTVWKQSGQSSDTAGAHRKPPYSNRSNMDGSSDQTSDGENGLQDGSVKSLVIPEKASSFSIHPGRICKDECSYCFGKFGLFDTPCHIAQMKSIDRQNKILSAEKHLTRDSCLCDACYRHVDRKANTPSYTSKSYKRNPLVAPGPKEDHCHVLGCGKGASNILRRKWIIKMRKSICEVINIDLDNPGLHSIPICDEHYSALEYLMICAMCKRRLAKNHIYYLGPETSELNAALDVEEIPLNLSEKPVVCKLCKYFSTILLVKRDERPENSCNFFEEYKKRLLHFNKIVPMDDAAAEEPIVIPVKEKKCDKDASRKKVKLMKIQRVQEEVVSESSQPENEKPDQNNVPFSDSATQSSPGSPSDYTVDYNTLIPSIAMDCGSDDSDIKKDVVKPNKLIRPENVKQAVEISKNMKLKNNKTSDIAVQRLGSNPSISVRQLFPCEEDLPLQANLDFGNVKERTPEGWEKCTSIVQYDMETKHLWHELQKPYGNQSSFVRHLILLEKYFRNGDLILSPNASHHSINYSESVHNRLRAYDNIPSSAGSVQPISMVPFNRVQKSTNGIITSTNHSKENLAQTTTVTNSESLPKNTPITISSLNTSPILSSPQKPKHVGAPPGLISLHPGTTRPIAPLTRPQSQKIKFPITKNWRPNLIPIDPNKNVERRAGLVQVISGGKPYHITLEDYKKMCAIKKSFDLKQRRLQEANSNLRAKSFSQTLKSISPKKGLVISKSTTRELESAETVLAKLDKQGDVVGESRLNENEATAAIPLPKIPKSLTVIPQTISRRLSRPSSPILLISKPKQTTENS